MAAALWLSLLLAACQREPRHLPHEAYVWQRVWTPAVSAALAAQAPQFGGWRVLALQVSGSRVIASAPDLAALASGGRPVRAVVRIEGARSPLAVAALTAELLPLLARWRAAGVRVPGIEIDHDCASAALSGYAQWLRELRAAVPTDATLSITALPTWLESPDLESVLAAADSSVLQVHAVERPGRGLFDAVRALDWVRAWDRRSPHPFAIALPAYGVRIGIDAAGLRSVDAEGAIERSGAAGVELRADPRAVADLIARLRDEPAMHLASFVWFRMPVAGDRRSWSAATLAAVISGDALVAGFVIERRLQERGSTDFWVSNRGNLDAAPPLLELPAQCRFADALAGYQLESAPAGLQLRPDPGAWVQSGESIRAGWARCAGPGAGQPPR